uniref:dynein axonemal heavy chain 17-like n=1 Tax=Myxine glutinosa TaxID=7769 RepID=UPI0035900BF2
MIPIHIPSWIVQTLFDLLSNKENHIDWPEVVSDDVVKQVQRQTRDVTVINGLMQGKTILTLPTTSSKTEDNLKESVFDTNLFQQALESSVIDWSDQIYVVLKRDSEQPLLEGLNPKPCVEIDFWNQRLYRVNSIHEQLYSPEMLQMTEILKSHRSVYWLTLDRIFKDIEFALEEATDICLHLKSICRRLDDLEETEYTELPLVIPALLHTICLIWSNSTHYNQPRKIIILLREICNQFIDLSRETIPWDFPLHLIFSRLDSFIQRISLIKKVDAGCVCTTVVLSLCVLFSLAENVFATSQEFLELENIELSGLAALKLSVQFTNVYNDFLEAIKSLAETKYDPTDINDEQFEVDYEKFLEKISNFDRRLVTIMCQAFDDCPSLHVQFCEMFSSLLERATIRQHLSRRLAGIWGMYDAHLGEIKIILDARKATVLEQANTPTELYTFPPVAAHFQRAQQLRQRASAQLEILQSICHPSLIGKDATVTLSKQEEMMSLIGKFEDSVFKNWTKGVDSVCQVNLQEPLLMRDPNSRLLILNFNKELVVLRREVRYLLRLKWNDIPSGALDLYAKSETYRQFVLTLELAVTSYNKVCQTLEPLEIHLVQSELYDIDGELLKAEHTLTWESDGVWEYIQGVREVIFDLDTRTQKAKNNMCIICDIVQDWLSLQLFKCKDNKSDSLLDLVGHSTALERNSQNICNSGEYIHKLLLENQMLFKAEVDTDEWQAYISYVDTIVLDGITDIIKKSFQTLLTNMNLEEGAAPMFEVQLELDNCELIFQPFLELRSPGGMYDLMQNQLDDIYHVFINVSRPVLGKLSYQAELQKMVLLSNMRHQILNNVINAIIEALDYKIVFEKFSSLWIESRTDFLTHFLIYGTSCTPAELQAQGQQTPQASPPTLEEFKNQIDYYRNIYAEVMTLKNTHIISGWFQVDCRPVKKALLTIISCWSGMFKEHLINHITKSLSELEELLRKSDAGLSKLPDEGDHAGLMKVLGHLLQVKQSQAATDNMFEPIKQTIALLKHYGQELPESVYTQLQNLPDCWDKTKKLAMRMKQDASPLLLAEMAVMQEKCVQFQNKLHDFYKWFVIKAPFGFDHVHPFSALDEQRAEISALDAELLELSASTRLFEISPPSSSQLSKCWHQAKLLKEIWDVIASVRTRMASWESTCWKDINVDQMDMETKKFCLDLRAMDKDLRSWDTFIGFDSSLRNYMKSLRSVGELQNTAVRERHWQELMNTTGVRFSMSESTTLFDLLSLHLHKFEEDVRGIVDKAAKEMSMEKVLKELHVTWSNMVFEHEAHGRTGTPLLKMNEELVETLEDNQVQLQNMMTSKYIGHFLREISVWKQHLFTADSVIDVWFNVQRTWLHLESIFIGSEDIRRQLPEDSLRFDAIDADFKAMMAISVKTPKVLEATKKKGLFEDLEQLQKSLSLCEKALADYLETKRLAFPRFYFVSSADLIDILSNGNDPVEVSNHLSKLFDSMSALEFQNKSKIAIGMYSKDKEFVKFDQACDCNGQVEFWLNRLLDRMRDTVRHEMSEAVIAYGEKYRDQWIFDYPAQVILTSTQIWWTTEVEIAFKQLRGGTENAMINYNKKQVSQLNAQIQLLIGNLSVGDRQKIMTVCTIDVHARDVVEKIIDTKVADEQAFTWQSQLRHRWDENTNHCFANICDAQFRYCYEYLGNTPRLVITPLTDRCYITLTQSLHLIMGGAPAGPAGTGKTETTKDLGRALGIMVYVFNCSEQMDYKSCGDIFKGLAQTGAWGCFDEFNRISVEVLSVVAVQVKAVQDAIRDKKKKFNFLGEIISLEPSVGMFITMNPGYAGRTELPENLKARFRPCAMVVPDFELICEIMLVAEGFLQARILARKFITLYTLCKELLSKQDHYDWGLRAIKSVLVVAGSLKRSDPKKAEGEVLMRALRDFNTPKIVTDDMPVFLGLIGDLFPAIDVPRKQDLDFEKVVQNSVLELKLQPEDNFVLKVVQLHELLQVRHSVFIIGNAGTGKSQVLLSLNKTYQDMKLRPVTVDLDPKAVTCDELFGIINPATREWKDGLFSTVMRDLANVTHSGPKWIILDGDIDPMWIESLNTVMDDNKVLTLASNERIPLNPTMRLVFEISHLRTATPATVSRAGILYMNPADLGWNPIVTSWIERRTMPTQRANLHMLFQKYLPSCLEHARSPLCKKIAPVTECSLVQTLLDLNEALMVPENIPVDSSKELIEIYFVFAAIWAFGGAMFQDQLVDYRVEFSKWWVNEFKAVKFPSQGTVFDYCIDRESKKFVSWTDRVPKFQLDPDLPLQAVLVHTPETIRLRFFLDLLMESRRPVLLVGNAGTGKSVLLSDKLRSLDQDLFQIQSVPFNFYTTSAMLQAILEKPLEKKAGRNYGPSGTKRLIYFIDDVNMPEVDKYFTVAPHTLIRQHMDRGHWYDRTKLTLKDIHNCQYVACMNPTAGSFTIDPRLQRHFCLFALSFPGTDALVTIYKTILTQHAEGVGFATAVKNACPRLVQAAIALHQKVSSSFLPTAIKFHYIFNLRDLSNIFQGLLFSTTECVRSPTDLLRLWFHESQRVYGDKLIDAQDFAKLTEAQIASMKNSFEGIDEKAITAQPNLYCHFALGLGDPKYMMMGSWEELNKLLTEALEGHNEVNAAMNLVLFEDAMAHICRINRILESPRGNALLVGVGGSGKQSLSRLSAYISGLEVFQITLSKGYGISDLKLDLASQCLKAGVKNIGTMFLMTDAQVSEETFLVLINDLLASGDVPGLFSDDEVEGVISALRNEVKQAGLPDSRQNCWNFFVERVRRQLKVVLCFSPVGSTLRIRARKFPAIVNCTNIDWFYEWPEEALLSVSSYFLEAIEGISPEIKSSISQFMSFVHTTVNEASQSYVTLERRYNYTTPKTFLEQIKLYQQLLNRKRSELHASMERLRNGLEKLESTASQVDELKERLAIQEVELKQKNEDADKLIQVVAIQTEKVSREKDIVDAEEIKVQGFTEVVSEKQRSCEADLAEAEPALINAEAALNTLNKNNLTELKSFGAPPPAVANVAAAVMILLAPKGKVSKDRSWKASKVGMAKVDAFLDRLKNYDKENIPETILKAIQPYLDDKEFDPEFIKAKSLAAAGLCSWAINIVLFYNVHCNVKPKRQALHKANSDLKDAQDALATLKAKIAELDANLAKLNAKFDQASDKKLKCQKEADATNATISLANRLVSGLASEKVRWAEAVQGFQDQEKTLCGDVLLVTAFCSYLGYFTRNYRTKLMDEKWLPFLNNLTVPIPMLPGLDPLTLLTDDAEIASWSNQGLPSDRMSIENASVLCSTQRWPLVVDPQLQGLKWIKNKFGDQLKVIRLGQHGYLESVERAVSDGATLLIENIEETIDAVLDPLLARNTIKKGKYIKIGDREVSYHPNFRLLLHTKLANPHYQPELQAQCTLINFLVTRAGLEEQLLASVVAKERPDLEELKANLTTQQNNFKISLKQLEDSLLARLSSASGNFLGDIELVENLESTKITATEIEQKVAEAKATEVKINEAREFYRPAAIRASLLYFILNDLNKINPIYQFSLKAFHIVFEKAIELAEQADEVVQRVTNLIEEVTFSVFNYTSRGLFERDKLIFTAQVAFQVLLMKQDISAAELDFLLRFPAKAGLTSPVDFLSNQGWGGIKALCDMEEFKSLDSDIEGSAKHWKSLVEAEAAEKTTFPQEWRNKTALQKLCMMRCLRPDRMTYAMWNFIEEKLGTRYVEGRSIDFAKSYEESGPSTPVFFILSPGVDPLKDVEALGRKLGFTLDNGSFHNVSLGQGQEVVAEQALDVAAQDGHWVILQNIHLVSKWLPLLDKKVEKYRIGSHESFRVYMSAEPAPSPEGHIIPQGLLENSIKITNEPPTGMSANLHKALNLFNQNTLDMCSKEREFKVVLFALCYFHAVVAERRKFGAQGWNRSYPFSNGDLTISVNILYNYLENNAEVPWDDLRYLFGEIMYGGHITDDRDRRLCKMYLEEFVRTEMLAGESLLAPGFPIPPSLDYKGYHEYVSENMPPESPQLYGLHSNAEIGFLTVTSNKLFRTLLELQPREAEGGGSGDVSREEKVRATLDEVLEKLPPAFNMVQLMNKAEKLTPFVVVAYQECERMNLLTREIRRSLQELKLGLTGELTITTDMEELETAIFFDAVPAAWTVRAYPSMFSLSVWYSDLLLRIRELESWTADFILPNTVWLGGLFNPQSFLTAIMQATARRNKWPLDSMALAVEVTTKNREDITSPGQDMAYIHGLFMEGARWDIQSGSLVDSRLKELTPSMPVILVKAVLVDRQDSQTMYECPVYKTQERGPTYVWTFGLRSKDKASKWVLAGVALLLQV